MVGDGETFWQSELLERSGKFIQRMIEHRGGVKFQSQERRRKVRDGFVEIPSEQEKSERMGEVVDWLVKLVSKEEVFERGGKAIDGLVEFARRKLERKIEVGERRREMIHSLVELFSER